MHIIAIIFGLLLLVFGGGCTLIGLALIAGEPENVGRDLGLILSIWLPFGLLPLVLGWLLFRYGLKIDRQKRNAGILPGKPPGGGGK